MNHESLTKFWPLIYSIIQEFWSITEPEIEDSAIRNDIPIELYLYSELGSSNFSRDPFTNPEQFEKVFVRLNVKGWIEPMGDGNFRVTQKAREAIRHVIQMGDTQLLDFRAMPDQALERLVVLLKQIIAESKITRQPPQKWAVFARFRSADGYSPLIVQIREHLMDLFAYRDDSHLSASRPHFNEAGIVWLVLGLLWSREAVNAEQIAEKLSFRGYDVESYEIAIQAAMEIGWVQPAEVSNTFCLTQAGKELREQAERLTDQYFYVPWSVLMPEEIDELYHLLLRLRDELILYRKSK
jgi:hypothetical protein